jgi:hypothetical protein
MKWASAVFETSEAADASLLPTAVSYGTNSCGRSGVSNSNCGGSRVSNTVTYNGGSVSSFSNSSCHVCGGSRVSNTVTYNGCSVSSFSNSSCHVCGGSRVSNTVTYNGRSVSSVSNSSCHVCGGSRVSNTVTYNGCSVSSFSHSNCRVCDMTVGSNSGCYVCGTSMVSNGIVPSHYNACGRSADSNNSCYVCTTCNLLTSASIAANSQTGSFAISTYECSQSPQSEALRLIQRAAAGWVGSEQVDEWRSDLLRTFQAWEGKAKEISQRHFWRILDTLEASHCLPTEWAALERSYATLEAAHEIAETRCDIPPWNSYRDLSARRIRSILSDVVGQLEELDPTTCVATVLSHLNEALSCGVLARADRRRRSVNAEAAESAPSTHDWVLDFAIHTGNSPPALADRRPAVGRAPVSLKAPRTVDHETVSRRENSTDFRNEICTRNTRVRLNPRSQDHPQVGRRVRPAGRRDHWSHSSLAQYA